MKIKLALTVLAVLISGNVAAKTWVLTSAEDSVDKGNWSISSDQLKVKDQIVYKSYSPTELKIGNVEYILVKEEDVLATVEGK